MWRRSARPASDTFTRVFNAAGPLPDLTGAGEPSRAAMEAGHPVWRFNQHESPVLRPADVAIYVGASNGAHDAAGDSALVVHMGSQAPETLHAIVVLGDVCSEGALLAYGMPVHSTAQWRSLPVRTDRLDALPCGLCAAQI